MAYRGLGHFVETLAQMDELVRVGVEVDASLEITAIADRVMKSPGGGPALLFERVKGSSLPLLINAVGSRRRMCRSLGVDDFQSIADEVRELLRPVMPMGIVQKLRKVPELVQLAGVAPRTVGRGACQQVVMQGDEVDLSTLPILRCWPMDGGRYVTLGAVYTRDCEQGTRNVGMYRLQELDKQSCAVHWQVHHDGAVHYRGYANAAQRMPMAVVLGGDPALIYAASAPLPPEIDEVLFAGFIRKKSVEMVRCVSIDMEVPADAEIVLEGYVEPDELVEEGPFGDHTGYYSMPERYPRFHVTAITMRREPIYPATIVGPPPMEDYYMGLATERVFLPILQMILPEVLDYHLPVFGVFHNFCLVRIRKAYPYHARKVMHAIWGMGQLMFTKFLIVVDEDVDVQNPDQVFYQMGVNVDPRRDCCIVDGPVDALDHAAPSLCAGSKMGIDATRKWDGEGSIRQWPPPLQMPEEILAMVNRRWDDYGITGIKSS